MGSDEDRDEMAPFFLVTQKTFRNVGFVERFLIRYAFILPSPV